MDIGVCMSKAVLAHKLAARDESNPEEAWNLARWPSGLSSPGVHRLFVAYDGMWRGYFVLAAEATLNTRDRRAPFGLLFDSRSWTRIAPAPATRFRGFTYDVPKLPPDIPAPPRSDQAPAEPHRITHQ
jgi:hypothetical protein